MENSTNLVPPGEWANIYLEEADSVVAAAGNEAMENLEKLFRPVSTRWKILGGHLV